MSLYVWVLPISGWVLLGVLFFGIATISRRNHINQSKNFWNSAPRREKEGMNR